VQGREESVEEFVRRNLGDEVFERLIEPFCSGTLQTELLLSSSYCDLKMDEN
jgi:protoporphyrinogen oxidase